MKRLLAALGGCAIVVGALLPWAALSQEPLELNASLTGMQDVGWVVALAGMALIVLAFASRLKRFDVHRAGWLAVAIAIGCGLLAAYRMTDLKWAHDQVAHTAFTTSLGESTVLAPDVAKYVQVASGFGLVVIAIGSLLSIIGGLMMIRFREEEAPAWNRRRAREILYFGTRGRKVVISMTILSALIILAIVGPMMRPGNPDELSPHAMMPPSGQYWFGTTLNGQDVFSQFVYGLGSTLLVGLFGGALAALIGMTVGFVAGYTGGIVDEALNVLTNVVLVIPTLALLLIAAAYLNARGLMIEAVFIGLTSWPWAARAIRAQTFSLKARDFVDLARLSGVPSWRIIVTEIAPNMASYLFMTFILMFGGAILIASTLDFIGLGPTTGQSLGLMMYLASAAGAVHLKMWWWFIPPGAAITAIVGSLYVMNVGLDEIFNPKLRKT